MQEIRGPLVLLGVLLSVSLVVFIVAGGVYIGNGNIGGKEGISQRETPPPPSAEVLAVLAKSNGFQFLISYTDRGFEPAELSVKKGETVRFTNNSSESLWVAARGDTLYPPEADGCGSSALDSCASLSPGAFWEFTFARVGVWNYQNSLDAEKYGIVRVQ